MNHPEYDNQVMLFEWANLSKGKYPELELLNGSLNGVRLNIGQAVKAKRSGMKKGYPDVFLPVARGEFHGLFIEMKAGKNKTSQEQEWWHKKLNEAGYLYWVTYGFESAKEVIIMYLTNKII